MSISDSCCLASSSCLQNPTDRGAWQAPGSQRVGHDWATNTFFVKLSLKTRNLYSHHNVTLRGACYVYKAGVGVAVELNLAIMYSCLLVMCIVCVCPLEGGRVGRRSCVLTCSLCIHSPELELCSFPHSSSLVEGVCLFIYLFLSQKMPKLIFWKFMDSRFFHLKTENLAYKTMDGNVAVFF